MAAVKSNGLAIAVAVFASLGGFLYGYDTGNISGVLDYSDLKGNRHSITVQCVIRDYEYEECPE